MVPAVAGALISAGGGVVNSIGNWLGIGQKRQDKRQIEQQGKLTEMQEAANKRMADYQNEKSMELWNKTDAKAQMAKYKEAGLNPALMYEGSGAGGTITGGGSASGVSGGQAADAASTQNAGTQGGMAMMQAAMMMAQIKNLEAQTKKTEVEASNIGEGGIDTTVKETQVASMQQAIKNSEAEINKIEQQVTQLENDNNVTGRTKDYRVKILQEEAVTGVIRNLLMAEQKDNIASSTEKNRSDIQVNNAKINQMAEQILQGWEGLSQGDTKNAIETFRAEMEGNYKAIGGVVGGSVDRLIENIFNMAGKERGWRKVGGQ